MEVDARRGSPGASRTAMLWRVCSPASRFAPGSPSWSASSSRWWSARPPSSSCACSPSRMERELIDSGPRDRARRCRRRGAAVAGGRGRSRKPRCCTSSSRSTRRCARSPWSAWTGDTPTVVLSTSTEERPAALNVARPGDGGRRRDRSRARARCVSSACRSSGPRGPMAVVVTVSTAGRRARRRATAGCSPCWVMLPAIVIVTVLLDWLARRLVHRRLGASARPCAASRTATCGPARRSSGRTRSARSSAG